MFTPFDRIIMLLVLYLRKRLKEEEKAVHVKMFLAALFIMRDKPEARAMTGPGLFQPVASTGYCTATKKSL